MDGWKMSFLLGPGLFKGAMLVLGRVSWRNKSNKKENQGLGMEKNPHLWGQLLRCGWGGWWGGVFTCSTLSREIPGGMVWEAYVPGEIPNSACLWHPEISDTSQPRTETLPKFNSSHLKDDVLEDAFPFPGALFKTWIRNFRFLCEVSCFFFPIRWAPVIRYKWSYSYNSYRLGL